MAAANYLPDVLETTEAERLATGFIFTEGPLWHPDGYWYFVDIRQNKLLRMTPGKAPEVVRDNTLGGNGTTFDLQGRLILCEGDGRIVTRMGADGKVETLAERYKGGRFNRPNDVICHSNGCLYFTDPDKRRPYHEREIPGSRGRERPVGWRRRLSPGGGRRREPARPVRVSRTASRCRRTSARCTSPTRAPPCTSTPSSSMPRASMVGRSIFADMNENVGPGLPDGLKVDAIGRVYCTGPGGIWVFAPDGKRVGIIKWPEQAVNFAFGGPDLRTMLCCAHTSVYSLRMKVPGNPHPWYKLRGVLLRPRPERERA